MGSRSQVNKPTVLYLYGLTSSANAVRLARTAGVDGAAAVEAVDCGTLKAWVSRVDAVEFGEKLPENIEKLDWIADASVRHQKVVGAIAAAADVVPARFGTVFLTEKSLRSHVEATRQQITATLKKVAGAEEWGVKLFAVPQTVSVAATAKSGADYLKQKSELLQTRTKKTVPPLVEKLAADLEKIAVASAPGGKISSGQRELLWTASYLVPKKRARDLQSAVRKAAALAGEEYRLEINGPWPPYSFI